MKNGSPTYSSSEELPSPLLFFAFTCVFLWITGCSPKVAQIDLPYDSLESFTFSGESVAPDHWWKAFNDEQLNILMDTAMHSNLSLQSVWHQFQEATAAVAVVRSGKFPQVDMQLQSGISRPEPDFVGGENTQLSLGADYEVDLWGRIRYSVHAEEYRFRASYFDYKTAAISLAGEIALTWFRIKATLNQLDLLNDQLQTNENILALIRARFASGQVRGVDILRQEQLIENTREQKITLETQLQILENQLSILLGHPPGEVFATTSELPELPPRPQTGIPLQLVNRRPDVQSTYYQLQASDRELAAAISNKYPRFNLSLTAAIRSNTFDNLFQSQAVSLSASLLAPLFYGGRLNAEVSRSEAIRQQLLNNYGQAVLVAFQEIENSLIREVKQLERIEVIEEQVEMAEKTLGQLRIEYLHGSIPYLDVLVTLNQQQQLRRDLITARLNLLEFRIALYRALAGGFETEREDQMEENPENQ